MDSLGDSKLVEQVDVALSVWCQGDVCCDIDFGFVYLADRSRPHTPASVGVLVGELGTPEQIQESGIMAVSEDKIEGLVVLTQTCDLVRSCRNRPYVEVAPLIKVSEQVMEEARLLKRTALAYIPCKASDCLVADLDRIMTVEKGVVAGWTRIRGCNTAEESRQFREAIGRKRSRNPFPDQFVIAIEAMKNRLLQKHNKETEEGAHLNSLREIRVLAIPSWDDTNVSIRFFFIKIEDPDSATWDTYIKSWLSRFKQGLGYTVRDYLITDLSGLSADDYLNSERLDLDSASMDRKPK